MAVCSIHIDNLSRFYKIRIELLSYNILILWFIRSLCVPSKECEIMLNENNYPVQLFCGTFDEHKEKFPYVDAIICSSVLEYIAKPEKLLINFHNILNDNGILIITVPNRNSYIRLIENAAKHINFILRKLSCINRIKQYSDYLSLSINRYTMSEFVSLIKKCNFDSIQAFYFSHKIKTEKFNRNASMLFFVLRKR